jgi:leucyl aminopeptidase (aminopeptidase T)
VKTKYFSLTLIMFVVLAGCFVFILKSNLLGEEMKNAALAQNLVNQCANINEGDLVIVTGGVRDIGLLEDIAVSVRKLGAFPLLTVGSDRMTRLMYVDVPVEYDSQTPQFGMRLAEIANAIISVEYGESMDLLADIPAERFEIRSQAFAPINEVMTERGVRQVSLGNGLYPIPERAGMFGITLPELSKIFWAGVNVDYNMLRQSCENVKAILSSGKEVHITNPNGTDFSVQIDGRPIYSSDGVISESDVETGGIACQVWLPAGEVYLAPVPGTAQGKIVVDRQFFQGKAIEGLTLTFDKGILTSITAKSGLEPLKQRYDASGAGKDQFAIIDIGVNPNVKIIPGSKMVCWMASGMVTVGVGNNEWAGGDNQSAFFMANFLPGSTLKVDDEVIVKNGQLMQ